jgi:hypothetical protein
MDPFNFVRADGGSFLPVVIFIIWFVFSLIGGAQKKKNKQMLEERRRREAASRPEPSPDSYEQADNEPYSTQEQPEQPGAGDITGDIKRELETIFKSQETGEDSFPPEKEPQPLDTESVAYPTYDDRPAAPAVSTIKTAAPVFPSAAVETAAVPSFMTYSYDQIAIHDHEPAAPAVGVDVSSVDDARKGVVWSEILSPCKALRSE